MDSLSQTILDIVVQYGVRFIGALAIFVIGKFAINVILRLMRKALGKAKVDETLIGFLLDLTNVSLLVLVVIAALSTLGMKMTSFVAILGAATLAVGLALQNNLSNLGAGVLIMFLRPFRLNDFVEVAGVSGTIEKISIFNTILRTPDNRSIIVPNSKIVGDNIINYSVKDTRRVDITVGIGYDDDIKLAKSILNEILERDDRVLKDPKPIVAVSELGDSSINFVVRPWVRASNYWNVYFDLLEKIKTTFDQKGISIPYPQMDVHLKKEGSNE